MQSIVHDPKLDNDGTEGNDTKGTSILNYKRNPTQNALI